MSSRLPLVLAACLAALPATFLSACGGQSPQDVVQALGRDLADGNTEDACLLVASGPLSASEGADCPGTLDHQLAQLTDQQRQALRDPEITGVTVNGDTAYVQARFAGEPNRVELVRRDGDWRLLSGTGLSP